MEYQYNEKKIPILRRLKLFFLNPMSLFTEIKKVNTNELYIGIILLITGLAAFLNNMLLLRTSKDMLLERAANAAIPSYYKFDSFGNFAVAPIWAVLQSVILTVVYILLISLLYSFIIQRMNKNAEYIDVLNVFCIAYMAEVLGLLVKTAVMFLLNKPIFLSAFQGKSILLDIFRFLDPFSLWQLALLMIGFSAVFALSKKQSAAIVVGVWLFSLLLGNIV